MKGKRRRHDPEFKVRVALEVIKGIKTIQEIAKDFDVHPVQVSEWKKTMANNAASVFGSGVDRAEAEQFERERERLHAKIGQQAIELELLRLATDDHSLKAHRPDRFPKLDEAFVNLFLNIKRENGYPESQIDQKRMSLEGVLVPVTARWNEELLYQEGFTSVDCFWRHLNFAGWVAVKP